MAKFFKVGVERTLDAEVIIKVEDGVAVDNEIIKAAVNALLDMRSDWGDPDDISMSMYQEIPPDEVENDYWDATEEKASYNIVVNYTVNGIDQECESVDFMDYEKLIVMAGYKAGDIISCTWSRGNSSGILSRDSKSVLITEGMSFNAYDTSNA
jgi:hypothetical protein